MENHKISIVMPVYNTEPKYLKPAVESVLGQTYKNFELIIVDDGSAPACAQLCDEIQEKDARIIVIHQKNVGVSTARNAGADLARGDYLMYMDSDDLLAKAALQEAVEVIDTTGAQFVFGGVQIIWPYDQFRGTDGKNLLTYHVFAGEEIDRVMHGFFTQRNSEFSNIQGFGAVNRGPVARLVRIDIARKVRFEGRLVVGEDVEWNMRLLQACDKVCFVSSIWYGYLQLPGSAMHKYYGNRAELLEDYHTLLYQRNRTFCGAHPVPYAVNMAVSFYHMVGCEYLSKECPLSAAEKRKEIQAILNREPWTFMFRRGVFSQIPIRYQLFLTACKAGMGIEMLKMWEAIKNAKKK